MLQAAALSVCIALSPAVDRIHDLREQGYSETEAKEIIVSEVGPEVAGRARLIVPIVYGLGKEISLAPLKAQLYITCQHKRVRHGKDQYPRERPGR